MILIICFILLISCFIDIEKDIDQCLSTSYNYRFNVWPLCNVPFLSIYRDDLDEELYCLAFQIDIGFINYNKKVKVYEENYVSYIVYKIMYYNLYYEYYFVFNSEFYNRYLKGE